MSLLNAEGDALAREVQKRLVRAGLKDVSVLAVDPTHGTRLVVRHGASLFRIEVRREPGRFDPVGVSTAWQPLAVAAAFAAEELAELDRRTGSYLDGRGNAQLVLDGQVVLYARPKSSERRRVQQNRSAHRPSGALVLNRASHQVAFALLCEPLLAQESLRGLAAASGVSLGTVQQAVEDLTEAGHLFEGRLVRAGSLLDTWADAYGRLILKPLLDRPFFAVGPEWWRQPLRDPQEEMLLGGAAGAAHLLSNFRVTDGLLYVSDPKTAVRTLRLSRTPSDYQVTLRDRFWGRALPAAQPGLVPSVLLYGDLLRDGDARSQQLAEELRGSDERLRALDRN